MKKVAFVTGYKPYEIGIFKNTQPEVYYIKKAIEKELKQLCEEGLEWVIISGQLGTELWAAEVVMELQAEYRQLRLAVLTPFLDQEKRWNEDNQSLYETVIAHADYVDAISKRPYEGPQQFRNKNNFLLQKSDCLVIVYDEEHEGHVKYLLESAKKQQYHADYTIHMIDFYSLQMIAEEEAWMKELQQDTSM